MKKRLIPLVLVLTMLLTALPYVQFVSATPVIKNVIFMIPDGAGYGSYDFAKLVKEAGGFNSSVGPNKTQITQESMYMEDYLAGSATTSMYNTSSTTDSAAAGTALATGKKTNSGQIGIDHNSKPQANLLEAAQSVGKATGLVSIYEWPHATPAAFSAHAKSRNDYATLYKQIESQGIDVVLGAGYGTVSQYGGSIQNAVNNGYTVINNKSQLASVQPGDKLWGNMGDALPYDIELSSSQATLADMTKAAITALSGDTDGFFLMVEGSKVDTGGHARNALYTTSEYIAFDEAFKVAVEFAKGRTDTIVVCAPDHDTGGLGNITYALSENGKDMSAEVAQVQAGTNPSTITWTSGSHTPKNVPVWTYVPAGVSVISGLNTTLGDTLSTRQNNTIDNTDFAPYVASFFGVDMDALTEDLFVEVTYAGEYDETSGIFTFDESGKKVYVNTDKYTKDGTTILSTNGEVSALISNTLYVPQSMLEDGDLPDASAKLDGITGSGTEADPYIIANEWDYVEFTNNLIGATVNGKTYTQTTYSGKYFKQTADIDLAKVSSEYFTGSGKYGIDEKEGSQFAGTYDGCGHTINASFTYGGERSIFPYIIGTVMNVGVTGNVENAWGGSFASAVRRPGKIVNCYSTVTYKGTKGGAGFITSSDGIIENCYFAGTVSGGAGSAFVTAEKKDGTYANSYYSTDCGKNQTAFSGLSGMSLNDMKSSLASALNSGRTHAAATLGVDVSRVASWTQTSGNLPTFSSLEPSVTDVIVTPATADAEKGGSLQLTATVVGENSPSQEVLWSLEPESSFAGTTISQTGLLTIDADETAVTFTVLAKSKANGAIAGSAVITVVEADSGSGGGSGSGGETGGDTDDGNDDVIQDGTQAHPWLISTAKDFADLSLAVESGTSYSGQFFKQTANIDMNGYAGYEGMGRDDNGVADFAGTYDGCGYKINVNFTTAKKDVGIFPYLSGTVKNLGVTGSITMTVGYGATFARKILSTSKIINCYSTINFTGKTNAGGFAISAENGAVIDNCYFGGKLSHSGNAISPNKATVTNSYYVDTCGATGSVGTSVTIDTATSTLANTLNANIASDDTLAQWETLAGVGPVLKPMVAEVETLSATLKNIVLGASSVTGDIDFKACNTNLVAYVAMYNAGGQLLAVDMIDVVNGTTSDDFELNYTVANSTTYYFRVFLWDSNLTPLATVYSTTASK